MKIISYNVNGLRAAIKKDFIDWLKKEDPDIIGIQETKSQPDQIDAGLFEELGYNAYWHSAERKGYSGVLTLSKIKPDRVRVGMDNHKYDCEGRILRTDFGEMTMLNCYFPSGSSSELRHSFKMEFLADFLPWVEKLIGERKELIIMGDYNVVRLDIDIHNPERRDNPSGFRPEERQWLSDWFDKYFTDSFRKIYPELKDAYSWWSYRAGSRRRNKGWRIDYISVTNNLAEKIRDVRQVRETSHSDHAPVIMEIDL